MQAARAMTGLLKHTNGVVDRSYDVPAPTGYREITRRLTDAAQSRSYHEATDLSAKPRSDSIEGLLPLR
jgi:hypothetical protein